MTRHQPVGGGDPVPDAAAGGGAVAPPAVAATGARAVERATMLLSLVGRGGDGGNTDYAARPGSSADIVRGDVARARRDGHALNPGRFMTGSWGIGVPVRSPDGRVARALPIAAVDGRMGEARRPEIAPLLDAEAAAVAARLEETFRPLNQTRETRHE